MRFLRITFGGICFFMTVILVTILLSACQTASENVSVMVSPGGIKVESLMPKDAVFMFKIGTSDAAQIDALQDLIKKFPNTNWDELEKAFAEKVNNDPENNGISYENDLKPLITKDLSAMIAVSGDLTNSSSLDFVIAITGSEAEKMKALVGKTFPKAVDMEKQQYKNYDIYFNKNKDTFYTFYGDVYLLANRMSAMTAAIDAAGSGGESLLTNPVYQKGIKKTAGGIGFFYFDVQKYFALIKGVSGEPALTQMLDNDVLKGIQAEVFALYAEKDGIRLKAAVYGDGKILKEAKIDFPSVPMKPAYLFKVLAAKDLIFYSEASDLKKLVDMEAEILKNLEGFDKVSAVITASLKSVQLDPEKDLYAFMDKGYALAMYDSGTTIPSIAFYIDASSSSDGAKKVSQTISDAADNFLSKTTEPEVKKFLKNEKKESAGEDNYVFSVDLSESAAAQGLDAKSAYFEMDYGLTADKIFYLGVNVPTDRSVTLDKNPEFNRVKQYILGDVMGLCYFETAPLIKYLDRIIENTFKTGAMTQEDKDSYETVKSYILPIKSMVFYGFKSGEDTVLQEGFIRIE